MNNTEQLSFSAIQWKLGDKCLVLCDGKMSEAKIWELNQNDNIAQVTFAADLFDERYGNVGCHFPREVYKNE